MRDCLRGILAAFSHPMGKGVPAKTSLANQRARMFSRRGQITLSHPMGQGRGEGNASGGRLSTVFGIGGLGSPERPAWPGVGVAEKECCSILRYCQEPPRAPACPVWCEPGTATPPATRLTSSLGCEVHAHEWFPIGARAEAKPKFSVLRAEQLGQGPGGRDARPTLTIRTEQTLFL